jgi:hypothetical protein
MFAASLAVALLDTVIPLFIGRLVALMQAPDRQAALTAALPMLLAMVALVLVAPAVGSWFWARAAGGAARGEAGRVHRAR